MRSLSRGFIVVRWLALVCVAAAALLGALPARAQSGGVHGQVETQVPDRTDAGVWHGTWYYTSRDFKMALWIRMVDAVPQVKLRYLSLAAPEGFETDWEGSSDYFVRADPASFALRLEEGDANTIRGRWEWDFVLGSSSRIERGTFKMYRTGDGRFLAMRFDELIRTVTRAGERRVFQAAPVWTFRKASKRLVLWDELPF